MLTSTRSAPVDPALTGRRCAERRISFKAHGARLIIPAGGKVVASVGEPPKRIGVTEYEGVEKAQAYLTSDARKALAPEREKAVPALAAELANRPMAVLVATGGEPAPCRRRLEDTDYLLAALFISGASPPT